MSRSFFGFQTAVSTALIRLWKLQQKRFEST